MSISDRLRLIGPIERALFLRTLEPLEALPPADVAVFAENARERAFRTGEALYRSGERAESFQILVEGSVRATGAEHVTGEVLGPRSAIGVLSMLAQSEAGLNAIAEEECVTLEFEQDVFHDIIEDNFAIVHNMIRRMAQQTLEVRRQIPSGTYLAPLEGFFRAPDRPLDLVERIVLIRRPGSPFQTVSLEAVAQLARSTPEFHFGAGETLWKSGDRSDYALILIAGTVACTTQWGISRFRAGPGQPLGNLERLSGAPRWFTAVTETPVVAMRSETETFLDILEDHFEMAMSFVKGMARNVIQIREGLAGEGEPAAIARQV